MATSGQPRSLTRTAAASCRVRVSADRPHGHIADLPSCAVFAMLVPVGFIAPAAASGARPGTSASSWRFNQPTGVSSDGTHVWVTNFHGNDVTDLKASTGGLVKVLPGASYRFDHPLAISSNGVYVWVANYL